MIDKKALMVWGTFAVVSGTIGSLLVPEAIFFPHVYGSGLTMFGLSFCIKD